MPKPKSRAHRRKNPLWKFLGGSPAALRTLVRPMVRALVAKEVGTLEDRIDSLESASSLARGNRIPAAKVWKELGL